MADRTLGGRYTIQDKVGIGGMATVYRGLDNVLGRTVAIKTMLPQYAADPSFAARFKQEAQAAAALQSPYIVGVYDWGRDQDTYYIVMEYLRGTDLKSGIRKHGALDCRKVAQIGSQICQALSVAHNHDIIHRDIKPQNIMVQPDGNIKVMDFGIARAKNSHLTQDNSVLGTAHYVSPEQTQGKELGPTSDLYSLGIVMYEAACGKVPFDGDDAISVALKQVNEQPVPPSQVNPNVDATLEGIILKCMQKNPADRFQTADELRRVLNDYLAGRIVNLGEATSLLAAAPTAQMGRAAGRTQTMARAAVTPPVQTTGRISTVGAAQHGMPQMPEEKPTSKGKVVGIVLAVVAVIAAAIFAITTFTSSPDTQAVPNLSGLTEAQARAKIAEYDDYFTLGDVKKDYSDTVEEGKLISQDPAQGENKPKGTKINLVISQGKKPAEEVEVPDLKNMTPEEANAALEKLGLKGATGNSQESSDVENGHVASQEPAAGEKAKEGDTVTYHLSSGAGSVEMISVYNMSESDAKEALAAIGITNVITSTASSYNENVAKGCVSAQSVSEGTKVSKDTQVTLTISRGPRPASTGGNSGSPAEDGGSNTGNNGGSNTGGNAGNGGGSASGGDGSGDGSGNTGNNGSDE